MEKMFKNKYKMNQNNIHILKVKRIQILNIYNMQKIKNLRFITQILKFCKRVLVKR